MSFLLVSAQLFCILLKIKYGFRFQGQFNEVIHYFSELAALTTKYGMSLQRHIHSRPSEYSSFRDNATGASHCLLLLLLLFLLFSSPPALFNSGGCPRVVFLHPGTEGQEPVKTSAGVQLELSAAGSPPRCVAEITTQRNFLSWGSGIRLPWNTHVFLAVK